MGMTWRPLGLADAKDLTELVAEIEAVDHTGEHYSTEDMAEELADPGLDLAVCSTAILDGSRMIGYGVVRDRSSAERANPAHLDGAIHPAYRRRGLGRQLLDWLLARAGSMHRDRFPDLPGSVTGNTYPSNPGAIAVYEAAGFRAARWFFDMRCDLTVPVNPAGSLPADLLLTGFEPHWDEPLRQARNEAFVGHWGSVEQDAQSWRTWWTGPRSFRPELSFLLLEPATEQIVAFLLTHYYDADTAVHGRREAYVQAVGTHPGWRGRGLATGLLTHALQQAKEQGYHRATLSVDADNQTGALGVYERCGFAVVTRRTTYARDLPSRPG